MGKSRRRNRKQSNREPYMASKPGQSSSVVDGNSGGEGLLSQLNDLNASKRHDACSVIMSLFTQDGFGAHHIATPDILSSMCLRLQDSDLNVRLEATKAMRNVASSSNVATMNKLMECGVFDAAMKQIAIYAESIMKGDTYNVQLLEELIPIMAAMLSMVDDDAQIDSLLQKYSILPTSLSLLTASNTSFLTKKGIIDTLAIVTDGTASACQSLKDLQALDILYPVSQNHSAEAYLRVGAACIVVNTIMYADGCNTNHLESVLDELFRHISLPQDMVWSFAPSTTADGISTTSTTANGEATSSTTSVAQEWKIESMKIALETIANLVGGEEEEKEGEGDKEGDKEEDMRVVDTRKKSAVELMIDEYIKSKHCYKYCQSIQYQHFSMFKNLIESGNPLTDDVSNILELMARISITLANIIAIPDVEVDFISNVNVLIEMINFLIDAVQNVTITIEDVDGKTKLKDSEIMVDEQSGMSNRKCLTAFSNICATLIEQLTLLCSFHWNETGNECMQNIVMMLCRGVSMPNFNIAFECIKLVSAFAMQEMIPTKLNAILSNAMMRRVENGSSFRLQTSQDGSQKLQDVSVIIKFGAIESIIDLHSSDDPQLFENFCKLKLFDKLQLICTPLAQELERYRENEAMESEEEREEYIHCEEISNNLMPFLQYKLSQAGN